MKLEEYQAEVEIEYKSLRNLAAAVIHQALDDAIIPYKHVKPDVIKKIKMNKREAELFLNGDGNFRKQLELMCDILDISASYVNKIYNKYKNKPNEWRESSIKSRLNNALRGWQKR